jgi:cation diffusion facilitator family transporter
MGTDRAGRLRRAGLVVVGANLFLLVTKVAVWQASGSLAVGSEAANSLGDVATGLIVLGGLYLTTQPPDLTHPHGHERIEPFVSLFVAIGILSIGVLILLNAAQALLTGAIPVSQGPAAVVVLVLGIGVKYALYRYCRHVGDRANSPVLIATAADSRIDILATGAALLGVLGALAGVPVLDPAAAILVALFVCYTGIDITRDNLNYLLGAAPPESLRDRILRRALVHPDVEGVHDVIAHYVGPEVDVSLHIEVEGERTLNEAHDIETAVIQSIQAIDQVDDVFVHVDPKELGEWKSDAPSPPVVDGGERASGDVVTSSGNADPSPQRNDTASGTGGGSESDPDGDGSDRSPSPDGEPH